MEEKLDMAKLMFARKGIVLPLCLVLLTNLCLAQSITKPAISQPRLDCYISSGDNWWFGESLAVDSENSMNDALDMLKNVLGVQTLYWRGLEEASWVRTAGVRPENVYYGSYWGWSQHLINDMHAEKLITDIAHKKGMKLWGVGSLCDWGSPADTPGFNDFPFNFESKLRQEHPEWAPVDKYGYRRQGGTIEFAYPDARKALVELEVNLAREAGYDGIIFLTYVEAFSQRFQDEFGYSEPVVNEYKRRYGIDIHKDSFSKFAGRDEWYRLRGEYLTQFFRELKAELSKHDIKLGIIINPRNPHSPDVWATLSQTYYTMGSIYFDVETWVQEGIIDNYVVYGCCDYNTVHKTVKDMLWMTRQTPASVGFVTSSPRDPVWTDLYAKNVRAAFSVAQDEDYFAASLIPDQNGTALKNGSLYEKMKFLSQVASGKSIATIDEIAPFTRHENIIMRRLALSSLAKLKNPEAVTYLEQALFDPENGVRAKAMQGLQSVHGAGSTARILESLRKYGNHPLREIATITLGQIKPFPRAELTAAVMNDPNVMIKTVAVRVLGNMAKPDDLPVFVTALGASDRTLRYCAAVGIGNIHTPEAVEVLIKAIDDNDTTIANRAAISLANISRYSNDATRPLQSRMLTAIKNRFWQMGDGYNRDDIEWGYRSVGDALLAFGTDGETVLQEALNQNKDKKLAELAWRILYYREKTSPYSNEFNLISEKENDIAYSKCPPSVRKAQSKM
jgi:hypothetical protein